MVPYEAIQQKLSNELVEGSFYWVSVWVKLNTLYGEDFSTAALNVYLAGSGLLGNSRLEYQLDPNPNNPSNACDPEYRQLNANNKTLVKQIDLSSYRLEEWIQIHFIYEHKGSSKRDIIAFELIDTEADNKVVGCSGSSICLDNIEIMDPCSHPCAPTIGDLDYWPSTLDNMEVEIFDNHVTIVEGYKVIFAIVENANYAVFRIYNRWGTEILTRHYFDPNGLNNHQNPNSPLITFAIAWNGEDNNGNRVLRDVYTYSLWFRNCSGDISEYFLGSVKFLRNDNQQVPYPIPWLASDIDVDCCNNGSITIDELITGSYRINYTNHIILQGNSEFSGNRTQVLKAGEFIDFLPNTTIITNGFDASVNTCDTDLDLGKTNRFTTVNIQNQNEINMYPNPTSDFVLIESRAIELTTISIISIQGAVLFTEKFKANDYFLDMVNFRPGLYIIQLTDLLGDIHTLKLIRQ